MNLLWKSQSGFSIVQSMIIAGVIAGSSLVATRLMTDQKLSQKSAETRDQIEDLHNLVYTVLQNKAHCTSTMLTNGANTGLGAAGGTPALNSIVTAAPSRVVVNVHNNNLANVYMNGNVIVKSMNVNFTAPGTGRATLAIQYERLVAQQQTGANTKRTKMGYGSKEITKIINLRIQRDAAGFVSCYALTDTKNNSSEAGNDISKEFCQSFDIFTWDEAMSTCSLTNTQCPAGQIYTGIDSVGDVKCRKLEDWFDFNKVIDPVPSSTCPVGSQVGFEVYDSGTGGTKIRIGCSATTGGAAGGGGGGCFVAGTQVTLKDGTTKSIENVMVGDRVQTFDEVTKSIVSRPVAKVFFHEKKRQELYEFELSNGAKVTSNDIHPFYLVDEDRYYQAAEVYRRWTSGESIRLLSKDHGVAMVVKMKRSYKNVEVFNLHVDGIYDTERGESPYNHNYFANGVLVHNLKCATCPEP